MEIFRITIAKPLNLFLSLQSHTFKVIIDVFLKSPFPHLRKYFLTFLLSKRFKVHMTIVKGYIKFRQHTVNIKNIP